MKRLKTPLSERDIKSLDVGEMVLLSGTIFCGRDAVLPRIVDLALDGRLSDLALNLEGSVIFHTAVSPAGVGPTSSNKLEIESSMIPLSRYGGVKIHLGKGAIKNSTVRKLHEMNAIYAVIPPVTALLGSLIQESRCVAFLELGMEALYQLQIVDFPIIIAAAKGESVYSG